MTKALQLFTEKTAGQMRCYYGDDNIVYLNLGDTIIGLGFVTYNKKGKATIAWNIVKNLLQRFGYDKNVTVDDYIPENIFYLLAMKADNDAATNFQMWIANEVIPQIRRTGSYTVGAVEEHKEVREAQIQARKDATGVYEMFAAYARSQGDKRNSGRIYAKFSKLANTVARIPQGCRALANAKQLKVCAMAEKIIAETILRGIAANAHYKHIEDAAIMKGTEVLQLTAGQFAQLR